MSPDGRKQTRVRTLNRSRIENLLRVLDDKPPKNAVAISEAFFDVSDRAVDFLEVSGTFRPDGLALNQAVLFELRAFHLYICWRLMLKSKQENAWLEHTLSILRDLIVAESLLAESSPEGPGSSTFDEFYEITADRAQDYSRRFENRSSLIRWLRQNLRHAQSGHPRHSKGRPVITGGFFEEFGVERCLDLGAAVFIAQSDPVFGANLNLRTAERSQIAKGIAIGIEKAHQVAAEAGKPPREAAREALNEVIREAEADPGKPPGGTPDAPPESPK